jgi:hypothetical protein
VTALLELAKKGDQLEPAEILPIAADSTVSSELYAGLEELGKTELFPLKYRNQSHFASATIYGYATEDDAAPASITRLGTRVGTYQEKPYTFYLYKMSYQTDEGPRAYLGIAGGYKKGDSNLQPEEGLTGIYWTEEYDKAQLDKQFKAYLEGLNAPTDAED